jgi:Fe-S cluster assembly iron-binding protein IscA
MSRNDDPANNEAKQIISQEIDNVNTNPSIVKANGCAACHVLFSIVDKIQVNESEASDLLSQILFHDPRLNESFIEMVENIHMKQRMMGVPLPFSIKTREAKDKYIDSNLRNVLSELSADLVNYGSDIVLRKLLIMSISLEIAQNIGIDYHAATEELYYYMRKKDQDTHVRILEFIDRFYDKILRSNKAKP